jgi:short-subunit dehydrogenase
MRDARPSVARDGAAHVAVTGASGGLGQAFVREFARSGYGITMTGRKRSVLDQLAREVGQPAHVVEADFTDLDQSAGWLRSAEAALGPIDVLVNNAGSVLSGRFVDVSRDEAKALVELDLLVPLLLAQAVLPGMLARGRGTIVNIASTGALGPSPGMIHYCAAKAALAAASESLRGELRGTGVNVVTVYPGPMSTPMLAAAHAGYPHVRRVTALPTGRPADLARRVLRAVERRAPRVIYPRAYGWFRYAPWLVRWLLDHFTPRPVPRREWGAHA